MELCYTFAMFCNFAPNYEFHTLSKNLLSD